MFKKTDIKQIVLILVSAIVFMSVFFMLVKQIYVEKDTAFYTTIFSLDDNIIDSITPNIEYSRIKSEFKLDTITFDTLKSIVISPTVKLDTSDTELFLILSVDYNNKNVFWKSYRIQNQVLKLNEFQKLEQIQNFDDFYFDKDYVVKTYFWNNTKSNFQIKDIELKLYSVPQKNENLIFDKN